MIASPSPTMRKTIPQSVHSQTKKQVTINRNHTKVKPVEDSPASYLKTLFALSGYQEQGCSPKTFEKPRPEDIAAYDLEVVRVIRARNLDQLRTLHANGKNMNACNQFGESLLHMACRRGDIAMVSFMIREARVRVDVRDDFGRSPFHDACWTSTPNHEVMDVLIAEADPFMLIREDVRGSTPFDYTRRDHYRNWVKYLESRREILQTKIKAAIQASSPSI